MIAYDPTHPVFRSAEEAAKRHVMRRACRDQAITNARTIIRRRGETGDPALVIAHLRTAVANGATPDDVWRGLDLAHLRRVAKKEAQEHD